MGIIVSGLSKHYGNQRAVDDISFEVQTGEILGFLGPNGAGKSTTMKMLTCFIRPSFGSATLDGYNILTQQEEIRRNIGYLPEHNPLYLDMYVHEFLHFSGALYGLSGQPLRNRIAQVIEMTGLGREQHKKLGMLSKGYRQRAGLAQALLHDPSLLILDEPTTGLDPNQIVEIRELIRTIGKEKTILFSTHILTEVEAIAGRVVIINRGKIVTDQSIQDLYSGTGQEMMIRVEFEQPGFDWSRLQQEPGYAGLNIRSEKSFELRSTQNTDLRRKLFEESVRQDNPIFALMKVEQRLEDIFRNLTRTA